MARRHAQQLAIETKDKGSVRPAQPDRAFDDCFKNCLQIERRAADDLKHLRRRRLLLQRLGEIVRTLTQFIEYPRVLDGNDRLGCEVLK